MSTSGTLKLSLLDKPDLELSVQKGTPGIEFLGFQKSTDNMRPDLDSCRAIAEMPRSGQQRMYAGFLGKPDTSAVILRILPVHQAPLTYLTKKNAKFVWNLEHNEAYTKPKNKLSLRY
ncbi:uncharacterized protein [Procambarus clarkii]|uniref:uncharacterized protein n=1 Tax=Procambarus clarkii TaxID=6728 RepID=UPI003742FEED